MFALNGVYGYAGRFNCDSAGHVAFGRRIGLELHGLLSQWCYFWLVHDEGRIKLYKKSVRGWVAIKQREALHAAKK